MCCQIGECVSQLAHLLFLAESNCCCQVGEDFFFFCLCFVCLHVFSKAGVCGALRATLNIQVKPHNSLWVCIRYM